MKKIFLFSILMGALPLSMVAQDDMYFSPKKKSAEKVTTSGMPKDTYYSGSNRSVDEYNRRGSSYEVIDVDSLNDIIDFSAVQGVYPDSTESEDYALTRKMQRFEDYDLSANAAYRAGYNAGRWYSPWYYSRYGWLDPWYYGSWSLYDPWFWDYAYIYSPYYSWGWGGPYYYGYYHYGWGGYPYYSTTYFGVGAPRRYSYTGNTGTINLRGGSRVMSNGSGVVRNSGINRGMSSRNIERTNTLRNRTVGTSRTTTVNRSVNNTRSNTNFNGGSRMNTTTYSSGSSYSGGGGSSMSSGGASRGGGSVGGGGVGGGGGGGPRGGRR